MCEILAAIARLDFFDQAVAFQNFFLKSPRIGNRHGFVMAEAMPSQVEQRRGNELGRAEALIVV